MTPDLLSRTVLDALRRVAARGALRLAAPALPERVTVQSPPRRGEGDYGLSAALPVAKAAGVPAERVAGLLREELLRETGIARVTVTAPGFLGVTLTPAARRSLVGQLAAGDGPYAAGGDAPAADIAHWAAATGDDPSRLHVRDASSPLFRVQYAHARTRALLRGGRALGCAPEAGDCAAPEERALLALLADRGRHAEGDDSGRVARHLDAVSGAFFDFHDACPPLPPGDQKPGAAHRARLALAAATGTVLAGGLTQLGVTAPAHL